MREFTNILCLLATEIIKYRIIKNYITLHSYHGLCGLIRNSYKFPNLEIDLWRRSDEQPIWPQPNQNTNHSNSGEQPVWPKPYN